MRSSGILLLLTIVYCGCFAQGTSDSLTIGRSELIEYINKEARCDTQRTLLQGQVDELTKQRDNLYDQVADYTVLVDALKYDRKLAELQQDECMTNVKELKRQNVAQRFVTRVVILGAVIAEVGTIYLFVR